MSHTITSCLGWSPVPVPGPSVAPQVFGALAALAQSGALGVWTIGGWLIILTVGPVATIQLWRLQRSGLFLTATLCAIAFTYYIVGLFFLRTPGASLRPIL